MISNEILNMQVRLFRKFRERHQIAPSDAFALFERYDIMGFIAECYELLHVSGDESILNDIDEILAKEGCSI